MESFSSVFNRKTIMLGCLVGATVGVAYYGYKKWWTATRATGNEKDGKSGITTKYEEDSNEEEQGEKTSEGSALQGDIAKRNEVDSNEEGQDGPGLGQQNQVPTKEPVKPGFGGLKRGFLL